MHDVDSLEYGHYFSSVFDTNTGIWWHCYGDEITKISDFIEGVYTRNSQKKIQTRKLYKAPTKYYWLFISDETTLYHQALFLINNYPAY